MTNEEKRKIIEAHATATSRVNSLIHAGVISVYEVEQYSLEDDPHLFLRWANTVWHQFLLSHDRETAKMIQAQDAEFAELLSAIRPQLAAHIKQKYGSWAAYLESPEGKQATADADAISKKYEIKKVKR